MKRPMLVSGIAFTVICALLSLFPKSVAVLLPLSALVLILFLIIKRGKNIIIPFFSLCIIISIISSFLFYYSSVKPCLVYHDETCSLEGKIISEITETDSSAFFILKTEKINREPQELKIEITVPLNAAEEIDLYDNIYIKNADISIPLKSDLSFDFTETCDGALLTAYGENLICIDSAHKTPYYQCLKLKQTVTEKIFTVFSDDNAGLFNGMLFGEKNGIPEDTVESFRNSGIAHLLAVSGLHTSLWCGMLLTILQAFKVKQKVSSIICLLFLGCFIIISGFTPSVIRASIMMGAVLTGPLFKREADSLNSLGLAVTILLGINPFTVLNISFQLSALATLGVILSKPVQEKIFSKTATLPIGKLRSIINFIASNIIVSSFAVLFTMPVGAYYFGVFNLMSPVTNILCVSVAFYGMIIGIISLILLFIPITVIGAIGISFSDIAEFLFDFVVTVSKAVSSIKFCTIPVHKSILPYLLFTCAFIILSGYALYRIKNRKTLYIKATALITVVSVAICISIPIVSPSHKSTITIVSSGSNINLILRSGTNYAYINNTTELSNSEIYEYMPKATSETLKYYIPTYITPSTIYTVEHIAHSYTPEEIRISEASRDLYTIAKTDLPERTIIKIAGEYYLSDEITFEIIDTHTVKYVIIDSDNSKVFVHLFGSTDLSLIPEAENCDVFVFNGSIPRNLPRDGCTLILSADNDILSDSRISQLSDKCKKLLITSRDGTIQLTI